MSIYRISFNDQPQLFTFAEEKNNFKYFVEEFDGSIWEKLEDSNFAAYRFETNTSANATTLSSFFLPYYPVDSFVYYNASNVLKSGFIKNNYVLTLNNNSINDKTSTELLEWDLQVIAYRNNILSGTSTTLTSKTTTDFYSVYGGRNLPTQISSPSFSGSGYLINQTSLTTPGKFLTLQPSYVCRNDYSQLNVLLGPYTGSSSSTEWIPSNFENLTAAQNWSNNPRQLVIDPDVDVPKWLLADLFPERITWQAGNTLDLAGNTRVFNYLRDDNLDALKPGDIIQVSCQGLFLDFDTDPIVSNIEWVLCGISNTDVITDLYTWAYDGNVNPVETQLNSTAVTITSIYKRIGFYARIGGIVNYDFYFDDIDVTVTRPNGYNKKTGSVNSPDFYLNLITSGNSTYKLYTLTDGFINGLNMGDPSPTFYTAVANQFAEEMTERQYYTNCCDNLRKYEKAEILFRGQLGSYESARFYVSNAGKTTNNQNIYNPLPYSISTGSRGYSSLGGNGLKTYSLISDFVDVETAEWMNTIMSSDEVLAKIDGVLRPVVVVDVDKEVHLYDRDLFQVSLTIQDANFEVR